MIHGREDSEPSVFKNSSGPTSMIGGLVCSVLTPTLAKLCNGVKPQSSRNRGTRAAACPAELMGARCEVAQQDAQYCDAVEIDTEPKREVHGRPRGLGKPFAPPSRTG